MNVGSSGSGPTRGKDRAAADLLHQLAADRVPPVQADLPELPDVPEAQLAAVGQLEDEADVWILRAVGGDDEELAGHLEMDRQRGVA